MKALGDAASELPWLTPGADALVHLTRPEPSAWNGVRFDPGALALIVRSNGTFTPLVNATVLERSQAFLDFHQPHFVNWNSRGPHLVYRKALQFAGLAERLARAQGRCDEREAWAAGMLAPLGWLAICAVEPSGVMNNLARFAEHGYCPSWQCENWGTDHAGITRRLSRHWRFPDRLASVINYLGLPVDIAIRLGADPVLFQIVQLAVSLCQRNDPGLALPVGTRLDQLMRSFDWSGQEIRRILRSARSDFSPGPTSWQLPCEQPLLADLLRLALEANRHERTAAPVGSEQAQSEQLLHQRKMEAIAELAAGAGHEINNPLAVISGQAQYIHRQLDKARELAEEDPALTQYVDELQTGIVRSLKTIVGQSQRIHQVLMDLMAFARPAPARPQPVFVHELLQDAAEAVKDLAQVRKVRVDLPKIDEPWRISCDAGQTRTALAYLLRNAVEAAPPDGWVGLRAEAAEGDALTITIEDNGPGPLPAVEKHMFDPFFSGRSAGRGRGLGLSIAWRLIAQQSGAVRFEGHKDGITRFTLTLPGLATIGLAQEPARIGA